LVVVNGSVKYGDSKEYYFSQNFILHVVGSAKIIDDCFRFVQDL